MAERKQSELTVITKAKDLCSYIMTVTPKSPKQFRFAFVSRLQNLALSAIENLFRANDVFVSKTAGQTTNEVQVQTKIKIFSKSIRR